ADGRIAPSFDLTVGDDYAASSDMKASRGGAANGCPVAELRAREVHHDRGGGTAPSSPLHEAAVQEIVRASVGRGIAEADPFPIARRRRRAVRGEGCAR